ncbi:sigma-70 family RNA polymerase sigma factor [Paenibacillus thermotolerans]|uniref:sigma-70 family RNA polymerase sigma factor n=1 Tax=Paenibacillus thermotolerans TaxID=3027807 RepID=UPI0023674FB5|nr:MULTISPECIES: sigma-70 family RNA polymerase sigma factor [unclassified Paenibacillus]
MERARLGDTEAFGELIEQYRGKAHDWAERLTGDPYMADDVVQDALIRAFLHLGSLADTSRFLPWLHRIVRNQANMRLRRGGVHRKELPFSRLGNATEADRSKVDWRDLDSILYHLSRSAADAAMREQDPAEHLLRKELYETIHALLHCLNRKEQGIFKAYFFRSLSPEEIAAMYRMPIGSVYTYIHRSRQKLRKENIRASLGLVSEKRERSGMMTHKLLPTPGGPAFTFTGLTFVDSIRRMLNTLGDRTDEAKLMGISGFAFRMKISDKTTFADGIYVFDWRETLQQLMKELGYETTLLCGQLADGVPLLGAVERFPVVLPIEEAVIPFVRRHIDAGKPVLYFDTLASKPYVHEWAVIFGYDDAERVVHLTDPMRHEGKKISYDDVVYNPIRFLAGIDGVKKQSSGEEHEQARRTIRFAIDYARKGCGYKPRTSYLSYTSGLAVYDRWIGHLRNRHIAPNRYGMGQLFFVYAQAKKYAAMYLRRAPLEGESMRLALLASDAYEQASEAFEEMSGKLPFIRSPEELSPEMREECVVLLSKAKTFESAAIGYLEKSLAVMAREAGEERW